MCSYLNYGTTDAPSCPCSCSCWARCFFKAFLLGRSVPKIPAVVPASPPFGGKTMPS